MPPNVNSSNIPFTSEAGQKTIVVVGLGMAAVTFMEKIIMYDTKKQYIIKVFGDEPERKIDLCISFFYLISNINICIYIFSGL